jgi:hypothetical protein
MLVIALYFLKERFMYKGAVFEHTTILAGGI